MKLLFLTTYSYSAQPSAAQFEHKKQRNLMSSTSRRLLIEKQIFETVPFMLNTDVNPSIQILLYRGGVFRVPSEMSLLLLWFIDDYC